MGNVEEFTLTLECRIFTSTVSTILCEHQILHSTVKLSGQYFIKIENVVIFIKTSEPAYVILQKGALGVKQCVIDYDMITSFQCGGI